MSVAQPSLSDLMPSLYDGYVGGWSEDRFRRLEEALASGAGKLTERMVTDLIAAAVGSLGRSLIDIFLDAAEQSASAAKTLTLVTGENFRDQFPGQCPHVPDIVVCEEDTLAPVVVIEGKGGAMVNGGSDYCLLRPGAYSNQVIAYVQGCWTSTSLKGVSFLWIGPGAVVSHRYGPWGDRGIRPNDHLDYPLVDDQAWNLQETARRRWKGLAWEDLVGRLPSDPAGRAVAEVVKVWMRG